MSAAGMSHPGQNQWMLAITRYAQKLLDGLEAPDFIEPVMQRNWIGGQTEVDFRSRARMNACAFTTRADTMFGTTYIVLSPEHP